MASRTYLPALLHLLRTVCKYIVRWEDQIRASLPDGTPQTALTAVVTACQAMEDILVGIIPPRT
jgi:hypothetical protein